MDITVLRRTDFTDALYAELGDFVAARNGDPARNIGYLGDKAADVAAELRELEGDFTFGLARDRAGDVIATLGQEWDPDIGRAWLLGPWADTPELMDGLYAAVDRTVPAGIGEREIFCAAANDAVLAFADRHGFGAPGVHTILAFPRSRLCDLAPVTLPTLAAEYVDQFTALHDQAFPGTYAPAAVILDKGEPIWVAVEAEKLLGYVMLKLRPEFDDAQIEYVAVHESARGRGVGARLVTAALHVAFADERVTAMTLVTNNPVARRLYERVGFTLQQDMRSFRANVSDLRASSHRAP